MNIVYSDPQARNIKIISAMHSKALEQYELVVWILNFTFKKETLELSTRGVVLLFEVAVWDKPIDDTSVHLIFQLFHVIILCWA